MRKKIHGSTASYTTKSGTPKCDLVELARRYSSAANIPVHVNDTRAAEIALLSRAFLNLLKPDAQKSESE